MEHTPRLAKVGDAHTVATLLDEFNREFDCDTPGPEVLGRRLRQHLAGDAMFAVLIGEPVVGFALLSTRPSVWYDGQTAVLDELYVRPNARSAGIGTELLRFCERDLIARHVEQLEINVDGADVDAQRFYERNGYSNKEPGQDLAMIYYYRELLTPEV